MENIVEKSFEIWLEGFNITGSRSKAKFCNKLKAESFEKAVKIYIDSLSLKEQRFFDKNRLTFWGCKFYDNEKDARQYFG